MIEDITVHGFAPKARSGHIHVVRDSTTFLGGSPDQAGAEDPRRRQLHVRSEGTSPTTMNAAVSALRFFPDLAHLTERQAFARYLAPWHDADRATSSPCRPPTARQPTRAIPSRQMSANP